MNDDKYFDKICKKAYAINKKFFGFDIKYTCKLVYSRKEMDKEWRGKTDHNFVAFAWKNKIIIFARSVFEKECSHKLENYQNIVIHEMNHLFYYNMMGAYKPSWIFEGLALNLQNYYKTTRIKKIDKKCLLYTNRKIILEGFDKNSSKNNYEHMNNFYDTSYLAVKMLLKRLGKTKFINLLKLCSKKPNKNNYLKIFKSYLK